METDKIQELIPVKAEVEKPKAEATGIIVVSSGEIGDVARAITDSSAAVLKSTIDDNLVKGMTLLNVNSPESYKAAAEHRKLLMGLTNKVGDHNAPGRIAVRVTLAIKDPSGQPAAVAVDTTVGTLSAEDFYGPMATALNKIHKAVTGSRNELLDSINSARGLLESSILAYDNAKEKERKEAEARQKAINDQLQRSADAKHWMGILQQHGYNEAACMALLETDIEHVTLSEVEALSDLVRDTLLKNEQDKQREEVKEAIATAKSLGLNIDVKEIEAQAEAPVIAPAPEAPPILPVAVAVAAEAVPDVKGLGKKKVWVLEITDPHKIPAEFLLPAEAKVFDPDQYPKIKSLMRTEGDGLMKRCPGIKITDKNKLTQR